MIGGTYVRYPCCSCKGRRQNKHLTRFASIMGGGVPKHRTEIRNVNWPKGMKCAPLVGSSCSQPLYFCPIVHRMAVGVSLLVVFPLWQQQWNIIVPIVIGTTPTQRGWFRYIMWVMLRCYFHTFPLFLSILPIPLFKAYCLPPPAPFLSW